MTDNKKLRNWIEHKLGKRLGWRPVMVMVKGGRKIYSITFEDGTEKDYYIDFEKEEIEEY